MDDALGSCLRVRVSAYFVVMDIRTKMQVLAEWRRYREPRSIEANLSAATDSVAKVMESMQLADQLGEEKIKEAWAEVAGEFLAKQSVPDSLRKGVLKVRVIQPAVKFTLERELKAQLLKRLQDQLGRELVKELKFFIG